MIRPFLILLVLHGLATAPAFAQRAVALTLDDLPYVGRSLDDAEAATADLLDALETHDALAEVFVEGRRVEVAGETEARRALLRRWRDAGHAVENHGYSHLSFNETPVSAYLADVVRGREAVTAALGSSPDPDSANGDTRFFRAPYNQTGPTPEGRAALETALMADGRRLAPFTVEHADWMFNAVYEDALAHGDSARAERVGSAYLAQLDAAFVFAESLALDTFGRPISQVFLIHANRINADHLGAMLERVSARGYAFVSLEEAVADPAYATADEYIGPWGISWLHRWRVGLGLPNALRDEPEPPGWVVEAYQALGR